MQRQITPETLAHEAKQEVIRLAPLLRKAPVHLDRIAGQLERGKLTVRVSAFQTEEDVRAISRLVNRFVLAFIGIGLGIVSAQLFTIHRPWQRRDGPRLPGAMASAETATRARRSIGDAGEF